MPDSESYGDKINPLVLELTFHLSKETELDPMNGYLAGVASGKKFASRLPAEHHNLAMKAVD